MVCLRPGKAEVCVRFDRIGVHMYIAIEDLLLYTVGARFARASIAPLVGIFSSVAS